MHSLDSITTIIFALVAVIVIWKLRSVLGARTGSEKPPGSGLFGARQPSSPPAAGGDNVVRWPGTAPARAVSAGDGERWRGVAEPGSAVAQGLDAIAAADPNFSAQPFLDGAKKAYEMVVTAFAAGDRETLQKLLAVEVFDSFAAALEARAQRGDVVSTTVVSMDEAKIEEAGLSGRTARVTVRFLSKLMTATHDKAGTLVDGSTDKAVDMNDVWSFARDAGARDPNWKLVASESGH